MKRILIISLVMAFAFTGVVAAQPGPGQKACCEKLHHGMKHDRMHNGFGIKGLLRNAVEINLSDDQKEKLKTMEYNFQLERVDLEADVEKAQIELGSLMHDENASEQNVFKAIDKVTALKADIKKMHYRHRKAIGEVLTAEQKEQLKYLRKERMEKRGMRIMGFNQGNQFNSQSN